MCVMQVYLVDAAQPTRKPRLVEPRIPGLSYFIEHHDGTLLVLSQTSGNANYEVMSAPASSPQRR